MQGGRSAACAMAAEQAVSVAGVKPNQEPWLTFAYRCFVSLAQELQAELDGAMDVDAAAAGGEVDTRISLFDRCINAYGEARGAIKSSLQLGASERWGGGEGRAWRSGWVACCGHRAEVGLERQQGRWFREPPACKCPCCQLYCCVPNFDHWRVGLPPAGGADSEQLRQELLALDRAVQGLALELTIRVSVPGWHCAQSTVVCSAAGARDTDAALAGASTAGVALYVCGFICAWHVASTTATCLPPGGTIPSPCGQCLRQSNPLLAASYFRGGRHRTWPLRYAVAAHPTPVLSSLHQTVPAPTAYVGRHCVATSGH